MAKTQFDVTIEIKTVSGRNEIHDIVVAAESAEQARALAGSSGRVIMVQGVHGTGLAFRGF